MADCKICKLMGSIKEYEIIYKDREGLALAVLNPKFSPHLGRTAVVACLPEKHAVHLRDLEPEEYVPLIEVASMIQHALEYAFNPDDVWIFNKGQGTEHFNIDVIPIYNRQVEFAGHTFHPEPDPAIMLRSYSQAPTMPDDLQDKIRKQIDVGMNVIFG